MASRCLKVPIKAAERVRRELIGLGVFDLDMRIRSEGDFALLPLKQDLNNPDDLTEMGEVIDSVMEPVSRPPRTYKDILNIPEDLRPLLPSSFDVIGDVCIIKLREELLKYSGSIGKALLETHRNLRVVALDKGVKGEYRIRDLEVMAGENDMETIHVENNLRIKLDPSKVYFSPRLAAERMRIAEMVHGGRVLDMFAGVGPFSLHCARHGEPESIVGIDLNPDCIEFFTTNIRLNSLEDVIEVYLGDAREAPLGMGPFDRIIMNLPHGALDYLDTALFLMESGTIHLYSIAENDGIMQYISTILEKGRALNRELVISSMREVHNYSPTQSMMAFDLDVPPSS